VKFSALVEQVLELLQRQGRVSYRALKREFELDDDYIEDLKEEIIKARRLAIDEDDAVLVWTGKGAGEETENRRTGESEKKQTTASDFLLRTLDTKHDAGERRQLPVMFCDLVGSTELSDPARPGRPAHGHPSVSSNLCHRHPPLRGTSGQVHRRWTVGVLWL